MRLDLLNLDYKRRGDFLLVPCPHCESRLGTPDGDHHLGINLKTSWYTCLRCGAHGKSPIRQHGKLAQRPHTPRVPVDLPAKRIPEYRSFFYNGDCVQAREGIAYLDSRGVGPVTAYDRNLGFSHEHQFSIVFPFYELDGAHRKLVYYTVRRYRVRGEDEPKYLFPARDAGWPGKTEVLYNFDRSRPGQPVVLVEGVMDAIVCPFGVAVLGHFLSPIQAAKVAGLRPSEVIVMMDGDVGQSGFRHIRRELRRGGYPGAVLKVTPPPGADPASMGRKRCRKMVRGVLND